MPYFSFFDKRYGDYYEVYYNEAGEFEGASRSVGEVGKDVVYYDSLNDLPPYHKNQIEHMIWKRTQPRSQQEKL